VTVALQQMQKIKTDPTAGGFADAQRLTGKEIQSLFSKALERAMNSMQRHLQTMLPDTPCHSNYVLFCQDVTGLMRSYTANIRPLSDFFTSASMHYSPKANDPQMFGPGLLAYSIRLNHHSNSRGYFELFHYLYSGWINDLVHCRLKNHSNCVSKGMGEWQFAEFLITNYVPATILAGFNTVSGSILTNTYLNILPKWIERYLEGNGLKGEATFKHTINLIKMIVNGVFVRALNAQDNDSGGWDDDDMILGIHPVHQGILSVACHFCNVIYRPMLVYAANNPEHLAALSQVAGAIKRFYSKASLPADERAHVRWVEEPLEVETGEYVDRFFGAVKENIEKHWGSGSRPGSVVIRSGQSQSEVSPADNVPRLDDVMCQGLIIVGGDDSQLKGLHPFKPQPPSDYSGDGKAFPGVFYPIL
jgi:hypothetical protein